MNELAKLLHDSQGVDANDTQYERCKEMWGKALINEITATEYNGSKLDSRGNKPRKEFERVESDAVLRRCGLPLKILCENAGLENSAERLSRAYIDGTLDIELLKRVLKDEDEIEAAV